MYAHCIDILVYIDIYLYIVPLSQIKVDIIVRLMRLDNHRHDLKKITQFFLFM